MPIPARLVRWCVLPLALSLACPALAAPPQASPAVAEARALFTEALGDEEAARWSAALDKYRRVQALRDTSPVRFRIALCTMKLGHLSDARALFLQTVDGTQVPAAEDPQVGAASREAAAELATHLGYVRIDGPASQGNEKLVRVDGQNWSGAGMREVDPGAHVLLVQADDGTAREVPFTVGKQETRTVRLYDGQTKGRAPSVAAAPSRPVSEPLPRWPGYVGLGAGGALVAAGAVMLAMRESHVDAVTERCAGGVCAVGDRSFVEGQRDKAGALQAGGIAAVSVGAAGAAFGAVWLLVRRAGDSPDSSRVSWSVFPNRDGARASVAVAF